MVLPAPRVLMPGDTVVTQCTYNTLSRSAMTYGGLSTRDEMCLTYMLVYPMPPLSFCGTQYRGAFLGALADNDAFGVGVRAQTNDTVRSLVARAQT
jgi:hypothetical protein